MSQLVATPENDKWLDWLGRVNEEDEEDEEDEEETPAAPAPEGNGLAQLAAIIQRIVEKGNATDANVQSMLMDAHRQAIDMVASQGKGNTDLNALLDALTKAKALMAPAAPADPLASLNSVLTLIDKLKPATEKDPLESITRTLELLERIKRTAAPEPVAESGWERAISLAGGLLAPVLGPIGQAIAMKMSKIGHVPAPVVLPNMPAAPHAAPVPKDAAIDPIPASTEMPAAPVTSTMDAPTGVRQLTQPELAHIHLHQLSQEKLVRRGKLKAPTHLPEMPENLRLS